MFIIVIIVHAVVEEVLRSCTSVKVAILPCRNTLLQVRVLHSKSYLSKSAKILAYEYT